MFRIRFAFLFMLAPLSIYAQGPVAPLAFEVASIKPAEPITPAVIASGKLRLGMQVDGLTVNIGYMSLADLIPLAFKVRPYQVSGPDWLNQQRFDILAKMPEGTTKEQVPEMLQSLLAERFQLKVRHESRDHAVYALIVNKGGPKLKESVESAEEGPAGDPPKGGVTIGDGDNQVRIEGRPGAATVVSGQRGTAKMSMTPEGQMRLEMSKITMPAFAEMLTRFVDRPIIDMTELKGSYKVSLDLAMDNLLSVARSAGVVVPGLQGRLDGVRPGDASDPTGGSIFTSVQQLGLKLDSRKAPVDFVVVEQVERNPTEN